MRSSSARAAGGNAPTFYSQMAKVVDGVKQEKLGATSVVNMLRGKGVKAEEIKWSGIETWLEGKKSVTKAELQEFIAGSMLQIVEEQSDSSSIALRFKGDNTYKLYDASGNVLDTFIFNEFMGGYISEETDEIYTDYYEIEDAVREEYGNQSMPRWADYKLNGGSNYREIVFRLPNSSYFNQAMKVHWGDEAEGVLAHARVQDFGKMLFIEEIQSDWHNEGHKVGYKTEADKAKADEKIRGLEDQMAKLFDEMDALEKAHDLFLDEYWASDMTEAEYDKEVRKYRAKVRELRAKERDFDQKLNEAIININNRVPDAPFRDNYHEYVLKRLIREAAEKGYERLGWTTAEIQSKRFSEDYAEGYRIEYDQDIPKFLNKYGKKWGARVGKTTVKGTDVWYMDITDSMRNSVLTEGQPLYSDRDSEGNSLTAEQSAFFAHSKARDKSGKLLMLYHGTARAGFTIFDPSKGKMGGNWFTTSRLDADSYAGNYKHKLFDPSETDEVRSSVGGNFTLGSWMRFDTEADRADFLKQHPNAEAVKTDEEYDELLRKADQAKDWDEYDRLEDEQYQNRKELKKLQRAYDRYEWEHARDATIGELFESPERFSVTDVLRAWDALDSNNAARDEEYTKEDLIDGLREEHNRLIEDGEDGLTDFPFKARLPVGESGEIVNRSNNRTYAVYANLTRPYEFSANGRTLHTQLVN